MNTTNANKEEKAITVADLWRVFLTALPLMIIAAVLIVGIGYAYRKMTYHPQYTSKGSFLVLRDRTQTGENLNTGSETQLALLLLETCHQVVESDGVREQTAEKLKEEGRNVTAGSLKAALKVTTTEQSLIMTIRATSADKTLAKRILEVFMETAKDKVDILITNGNEFMSYCDEPSDAVLSSSFGMFKIVLIGILGAFAVYGVYLIIDILDDRIRTGEDISDVAGLTLLGIIPDANSSERKYSYKYGRRYGKQYGGASGAEKKEG